MALRMQNVGPRRKVCTSKVADGRPFPFPISEHIQRRCALTGHWHGQRTVDLVENSLLTTRSVSTVSTSTCTSSIAWLQRRRQCSTEARSVMLMMAIDSCSSNPPTELWRRCTFSFTVLSCMASATHIFTLSCSVSSTIDRTKAVFEPVRELTCPCSFCHQLKGVGKMRWHCTFKASKSLNIFWRSLTSLEAILIKGTRIIQFYQNISIQMLAAKNPSLDRKLKWSNTLSPPLATVSKTFEPALSFPTKSRLTLRSVACWWSTCTIRSPRSRLWETCAGPPKKVLSITAPLRTIPTCTRKTIYSFARCSFQYERRKERVRDRKLTVVFEVESCTWEFDDLTAKTSLLNSNRTSEHSAEHLSIGSSSGSMSSDITHFFAQQKKDDCCQKT